MATYLVTGATGFIGGQLIRRLLERPDTVIHALVREGSRQRLLDSLDGWDTTEEQVRPLVGDLTEPGLGLDDDAIAELTGSVDHVIHLGAVYDVRADADTQRRVNVEGTHHVVEVANRINAGRFHHVSSVAAAGRYEGIFTEDMLDEATGLRTNPYLATKHESERVARDDLKVPWRVYRPGIVVGSSVTGEIDKIDGPYYLLPLFRRLSSMPRWIPMVGLDGGPLPIVPVDFVVDAMDHILHLGDNWDHRVFHLVDPNPPTLGETLNLFARAAGAPQFPFRVDAKAQGTLSRAASTVGDAIPPIGRTRKVLWDRLGIPAEAMEMTDWRTRFDCTNTLRALEGTDIACPPLSSYAETLYEYWDRHLDPRPQRNKTLRKAIKDKRVMITGASEGIGRQVAFDVAAAGAQVLLVARTRSKLEAVQSEIEQLGGTAFVHPCDLSDIDDIKRLADEVIDQHGGLDILVNNAGRSIRRSIKLSYDRLHDFERTMQLNYFGPVQLVLALLPSMIEQRFGHIINVSSIGVQINAPRFSAYVASKAALDAFGRCIAAEIIDDNVHITAVHMPLVRTKMIAPTKIYERLPTLSPREASKMLTDAMIDRSKKVATPMGSFGEFTYAVAPKVVDQIAHRAYKLFPESAAAKGKAVPAEVKASREAETFARLTRGAHW